MLSQLPLVMLVDPDPVVLRRLEEALQGVATTVSFDEFSAARKRIVDLPVQLLVTNLRLQEFNGLHLVYVARTLSDRVPCVVYDREYELGLARMARQTGAFYERFERLPATLVSYVLMELPAADRRDPARTDRRQQQRGGRRAADFRES